MSGNHVHITYFPSEKDHPHGSIGGNNTALHLPGRSSVQGLALQFSWPSDGELAVRYLRELAAVATDLADQVQRRIEDETVKAVLES